MIYPFLDIFLKYFPRNGEALTAKNLHQYFAGLFFLSLSLSLFFFFFFFFFLIKSNSLLQELRTIEMKEGQKGAVFSKLKQQQISCFAFVFTLER